MFFLFMLFKTYSRNAVELKPTIPIGRALPAGPNTKISAKIVFANVFMTTNTKARLLKSWCIQKTSVKKCLIIKELFPSPFSVGKLHSFCHTFFRPLYFFQMQRMKHSKKYVKFFNTNLHIFKTCFSTGAVDGCWGTVNIFWTTREVGHVGAVGRIMGVFWNSI